MCSTRPIAGTRPRGLTEVRDRLLEHELLADPKEQAEHAMLVDLARNDLGRVCVPGSVRPTELMEVERFSKVMHIVSTVEGDLRPDMEPFDALAVTFPAGTVTGAPKRRAMELIAEHEPTPRGPYAGAVGYLTFAGDLDFCITIRTAVVADGDASASKRAPASWPTPTPRPSCARRRQGRRPAARRRPDNGGTPMILVVDHYDSLHLQPRAVDRESRPRDDGREVRCRAAPRSSFASSRTPWSCRRGRGTRRDAGCFTALLEQLPATTPVLGVCLGHQAIGLEAGGTVDRDHTDAWQGLVRLPRGRGDPRGGQRPFEAGRYHSLVLERDDLPAELELTAWTEDGLVMGTQHRELPHFGVQFHPESILTPEGPRIVENFLSIVR